MSGKIRFISIITLFIFTTGLLFTQESKNIVKKDSSVILKKIDSFLRLSDHRLADFMGRDFFIEWLTNRFRSGLNGYFDPNSDFIRSCLYRMTGEEINLFNREALMRFKLLNTQMLIDHGRGMKYRPVFIKIN